MTEAARLVEIDGQRTLKVSTKPGIFRERVLMIIDSTTINDHHSPKPFGFKKSRMLPWVWYSGVKVRFWTMVWTWTIMNWTKSSVQSSQKIVNWTIGSVHGSSTGGFGWTSSNRFKPVQTVVNKEYIFFKKKCYFPHHITPLPIYHHSNDQAILGGHWYYLLLVHYSHNTI